MSTDLKSTVAALKQAKDESGLQELADAAIEGVRHGLQATWISKLETVEHLHAIRDESLFHFAKMPNGKPFPSWKSLVRAIFKQETKDWTDKGLRNSWAVTLVDLGMSHEEAADALNTSKATVQRSVKDAEIEAEGGDPQAQRAAQRAAQTSKSEAEKLINALVAFMGSCTDTTRWTNANLLDIDQALDNAKAAVTAERGRRKHAATVNAGVSGRTGQTAPSVPSVPENLDKAGVPMTPVAPKPQAPKGKVA